GPPRGVSRSVVWGGSDLVGEPGVHDPGGGSDRPPVSTSGAKQVGGRNLPAAIVVGLLLAAVFIGTLFWHPIAFTALVAVLTTLAYVESGRVLASVGIRLEVPVLVVATLVM